MEKYELVKDIGAGNFGVARLMKVKDSKELVAMKYIERGPKARYFFQQLISGVSYCHAMQICHRDLKLENTLLDGSPAPRLKICDFGYSKSSLLHSRPKSTVGTPAYIAPEVLSRREYDGKMADVWSCGVTLYVMLVGAYPFEDQEDPKNFRKTIQKIMAVQYKIPDYVHISQDCKHLLSRIFVANSLKRITIAEIKKHPWFTKNLPRELTETAQAAYFKKENPTFSAQTAEEIMKIVDDAKTPPPVSRSIGGFGWGGEGDLEGKEEEEVDEEEVEEEEDEEDEYDKTVKEVHASGENTHLQVFLHLLVAVVVSFYRFLAGRAFEVELSFVDNGEVRGGERYMCWIYRSGWANELVAMKFIERGSKVVYTRVDIRGEPHRVVMKAMRRDTYSNRLYQLLATAMLWTAYISFPLYLSPHQSRGLVLQISRKHPWFLKNLPSDLTETAQAAYFSKGNQSFSLQTAEEIMKLVDDAKTPPPVLAGEKRG
ncbi:hypothetical protein YC2023_057240 [Brassica napus]